MADNLPEIITDIQHRLRNARRALAAAKADEERSRKRTQYVTKASGIFSGTDQRSFGQAQNIVLSERVIKAKDNVLALESELRVARRNLANFQQDLYRAAREKAERNERDACFQEYRRCLRDVNRRYHGTGKYCGRGKYDVMKKHKAKSLTKVEPKPKRKRLTNTAISHAESMVAQKAVDQVLGKGTPLSKGMLAMKVGEHLLEGHPIETAKDLAKAEAIRIGAVAGSAFGPVGTFAGGVLGDVIGDPIIDTTFDAAEDVFTGHPIRALEDIGNSVIHTFGDLFGGTKTSWKDVIERAHPEYRGRL